MTAAMPTSDWCSTLWAAIVHRYGCEGVASACLRLQDEFDVEVMVLLACIEAALAGGDVGETTYEIAVQHTTALRDNLLHPLRDLRRTLPTSSAPLPTDRLRGVLLQAELEAERLVLEALEPLLGRAVRSSVQVSDRLLAVLSGVVCASSPFTAGDRGVDSELQRLVALTVHVVNAHGAQLDEGDLLDRVRGV